MNWGWQPQDPRILKGWKKDGFTKVWRGPEEFPVKIGGESYIPYKYHYDKELKDYVWMFKRKNPIRKRFLSVGDPGYTKGAFVE